MITKKERAFMDSNTALAKATQAVREALEVAYPVGSTIKFRNSNHYPERITTATVCRHSLYPERIKITRDDGSEQWIGTWRVLDALGHVSS